MTTAVAVVGAAACAGSAQAAIEVDHGSEFVSIAGEGAGPLRLTVTNPAGQPIGVKRFTGDIELNHDGPPCFDGGASTPDMRPGDKLTVSEDVDGGAVRNEYVIENVLANWDFVPANPGDPVNGVPATPATLVITGTLPAGAAGGAEIRIGGDFPANVNVTGGDLDTTRQDLNRRLLITPDADNFTIRVSPITEGNVDEIIAAAGADGGNITMFSGQATGVLDCPAIDASRGPITLPGLPPRPQPPGDADSDGVTNDRDDCPNVAGPFNNDGCPLAVPLGGATQSGGTPPATIVTRIVPLAGAATAGQGVLGSSASNALRVRNLSLARRISSTRLRLQGLRASMRLQDGTKAVRIAVYKARNGQRTGSALFTTNRAPRAGGLYRVTLRDRALLRKLRAGSYVMEVKAGRSAASLGTVTRIAFTVTR
jgi:hypothetical protein